MPETPVADAPVLPQLCCLCGSESTRWYLKAHVHALRFCENCGLIYAQERHDGIGISADQHKFLGEYLREEETFVAYFNEKLDFISRHFRPGTLLDFGCGAGTFLRCARAKGWRVAGVEGSGPAAAEARAAGIEIWEGEIERLSVAGSFDLVTAFQSLEHLSDPVAFLQQVHRLLKPEGAVFLTTPNRESLLGRLLGKRWFGYYNDEHVFFYDERSLKSTLVRAGFSDVIVTVENGRALSPSWVLTRLFDYYYRHPHVLLGLVVKLKGLARWVDFVHVREPRVNLVAIGRKRV